MKKRLIVLAAIVASCAMLACSLSDLVPQREARVTATPTRTLKPTFTTTATPSRTPIPSPTPTPTDTSTPTPIPTDTPLPTDTPTPTLAPTDTQTPIPSTTPTATRKPTARPPTRTPIPRPTNTPAPPFTWTIVAGYARCDGHSEVTGKVKHANGAAYPGVSIGVWSDTWNGTVVESESDGKYSVILTNVPAGEYKVAVVKRETCSQQDGALTAANCQRLSQPVKITKTDHCTGAGANQVSVVDFTGS